MGDLTFDSVIAVKPSICLGVGYFGTILPKLVGMVKLKRESDYGINSWAGGYLLMIGIFSGSVCFLSGEWCIF